MYTPNPVPEDSGDLRRFINDELQRLRDELGIIEENMSINMLDISMGKPGYAYVNKFGRNTDVDSGTRADVWDGGTTAIGGQTYTYSTTADITHIVSDAADTVNIEVQGLDANWEEVTQTKTLTGTTGVALDTPLIRVFRMKNIDSTAAAGNIQCGVGAVTTSFTAANLRAQITLGFEQTLMAIYTVPANKKAYLTNFWCDMNRSVTSGSCNFDMFARSEGGVFRVQTTTASVGAGTSHFQHQYEPYPSFNAKTDIKITADASANNTDISAGFDLILVNA